MKLFVARHGQTEWNVQNKVCGITYISLTEVGIEQAKKLAEEVRDRKIEFIITSPLSRTVETCKIILNTCDIEYTVDSRLIEQNYGIYEGVDRRNEDFLKNKKDFAYRYPNGESMLQVTYRVYDLINEVKEKYKNQNIMFISHGGVCRIINTYFKDMTNKDFFEYTLENGKLEEYYV